MTRFLKVWAWLGLLAVLSLSACSTPTTLATEAAAEAPADLATVQPTETVPTISRTIKAGAAIGAFTPYTIVVPAGWTATHRVDEGISDRLELTQVGGEYPPWLSIYQEVGDSGQCHYAGETGEGWVFLEAGISIIGTASELMRGSANGDRIWAICEKGTDTFSFPTIYGYIMYNTHSPTEAILAEMDAMIASLAVAQ